MKFEKNESMGAELDVLARHAEHEADLGGSVAEAAKAAGLEDPQTSLSVGASEDHGICEAFLGYRLRKGLTLEFNSWLFTELQVHRLRSVTLSLPTGHRRDPAVHLQDISL